MRAPGTRLRAWFSRWCSARTMERLVDPAIADLQIEHRHVVEQGRLWRAGWIVAAGYVTLVQALAVHVAERSLRSFADWNGDEVRALVRTVAVAIASMIVATLLLLTPVRRNVPAAFVPYLVPQALPLTLPLAITIGILVGLHGRRGLSSRLRAATLALALICSLASFATVAWLVPVAGQMFRVSMAEHLTGRQFRLTVGANELRLGELREQIAAMRYAIREIESGPYRVSVDRRERTLGRLERAYHLRWALPCAPFVLALFALTIRGRTPAHWWLPALAALGACVAYYLLLVAGQAAGERGLLPPVAAAWLPNVLVVAVCLFTSRREPENSRT